MAFVYSYKEKDVEDFFDASPIFTEERRLEKFFDMSPVFTDTTQLEDWFDASPVFEPEPRGKVEFWTHAKEMDWLSKLFPEKELTDLSSTLASFKRLSDEGFYERYAQMSPQEKRVAIPFEGPVEPGPYLGAAALIPGVAKKYGERKPPPTAEELRQLDTQRAEEHKQKLAESGNLSFAAKVLEGAAILPRWMLDIYATAPLYAAGRAVGRKAGMKAVGKAAGWLAGSAARTTVLPARAGAAVLKRQIPEEFHFGGDGEFVLDVEPDSWASSIAYGWGEVFVETASEEAGAAITKGLKWTLGKVPFGRKMLAGMHKAYQKIYPKIPFADFLTETSTKAGYSNIVGEIGEERLATVMHGLVGTEDFGAGKDASVFERLEAGLTQDVANFPVEAIVLSLVPGGKVALARVAKPFSKEAAEAREAKREAKLARQAKGAPVDLFAALEKRAEAEAAAPEISTEPLQKPPEAPQEITEEIRKEPAWFTALPSATDFRHEEELSHITSRKPSTKEKFDFIDSLRPGTIVQGDPESRVVIPEKKVYTRPDGSSGNEEYSLWTQILDDKTGEWEETNQLSRIVKHPDGTYYGDWGQNFIGATWTDVETGERKSAKVRIRNSEAPQAPIIPPGGLTPIQEEIEPPVGSEPSLFERKGLVAVSEEPYLTIEENGAVKAIADLAPPPGKLRDERGVAININALPGYGKRMYSMIESDLKEKGYERIYARLASNKPKAERRALQMLGFRDVPLEADPPWMVKDLEIEPPIFTEEMPIFEPAGLEEAPVFGEITPEITEPIPDLAQTIEEAEKSTEIDQQTEEAAILPVTSALTLSQALSASGGKPTVTRERIIEVGKTSNTYKNFVATLQEESGLADVQFYENVEEYDPVRVYNNAKNSGKRNYLEIFVSEPRDAPPTVRISDTFSPRDLATGTTIPQMHTQSLADEIMGDQLLYFYPYTQHTDYRTGETTTEHFNLADASEETLTELATQLRKKGYVFLGALSDSGTLIAVKVPPGQTEETAVHQASVALLGPNYDDYSVNDNTKRLRIVANAGIKLWPDLFPEGIKAIIVEDIENPGNPDHPVTDGAVHVDLPTLRKFSEVLTGDKNKHRGFKPVISVRQGENTLFVKAYDSHAPKDVDMQGANLKIYRSSAKRGIDEGFPIGEIFTLRPEDIRLMQGDHADHADHMKISRQIAAHITEPEVQEAFLNDVLLPVITSKNEYFESLKNPAKLADLIWRRVRKVYDPTDEGQRLAKHGFAHASAEYADEHLANIYVDDLFRRRRTALAVLVPATGNNARLLESREGEDEGVILPHSAKRSSKIGDTVLVYRSPIIGPGGIVVLRVRGYQTENEGQTIIVPTKIAVENLDADFDADEGNFSYEIVNEKILNYFRDREDFLVDVAGKMTPAPDADVGKWSNLADRIAAAHDYSATKAAIAEIANAAHFHQILTDNKVKLGSNKLMPVEEWKKWFIGWAKAATDPKLKRLKQWGWYDRFGAKGQFRGRDRLVAQMFGLWELNEETGEWTVPKKYAGDFDVRLKGILRATKSYRVTGILSGRLTNKPGENKSRADLIRAGIAEVKKRDGVSMMERMIAASTLPKLIDLEKKQQAHESTLAQLKKELDVPKVLTSFNDDGTVNQKKTEKLKALAGQIQAVHKEAGRLYLRDKSQSKQIYQRAAEDIRAQIEEFAPTDEEFAQLSIQALQNIRLKAGGATQPIYYAVPPWTSEQPDILSRYAKLYNQAYGGVGEPAQPSKQLKTERLLEEGAPTPSKIVEAAKEEVKKVEAKEEPTTFAAAIIPLGPPKVLEWAAGEKGKVYQQILGIAERNPEMIKYFDGIATWAIGKKIIPENTSEAQQVLRELERYEKQGRKAGWWARNMRLARRVGELNATKSMMVKMGATEEGKPVFQVQKIFEHGRRQIGIALSKIEQMRTTVQEPFLKGDSRTKGLGALGELGSYETMVAAGEELSEVLEGERLPDQVSEKYANDTNFTDPLKRSRRELDIRREEMGHWEGDVAEIETIRAKGSGYGAYVTVTLESGKKERRFLVYGDANRTKYEAFQIRKGLKENYYWDEDGNKVFYEFRPYIPRDGDYFPHMWESQIEFRRGWAMMMERELAPVEEKYGKDSSQYKKEFQNLVDQYWQAMDGFRADMGVSLYGQSRFFGPFQHRRRNVLNFSKNPFYVLPRYIEGFDKMVELDKMVIEAWENRKRMKDAGESDEVIEIFDRLVNDALGRPSAIDLWALRSAAGKAMTKVGIPIDQQRPFFQMAYWEGWYRFSRHISFRPITAEVNLGQARNTILYEGIKAFRNALGASKRGKRYETRTDKEGNPILETVPEIVMNYSGVFTQMTRSEIQDVLRAVQKGEFGFQTRRLLPKALGGHKSEDITSFEALRGVLERCKIETDHVGQWMFNWSERKTRAWAFAVGYTVKRDIGLDHKAAVHYGREVVERDILLFNAIGRSAFMNSNLGKIATRYTLYPIGQNLWCWRVLTEFTTHPTDRKAMRRIIRAIATEGLIRSLKMIPFISITIADRWGDEAAEFWMRVWKAFVVGDTKELRNLLVRNPLVGASISEVIGLLVGFAGWPGLATATRAPALVRIGKKLPYGQAVGMLYDFTQGVYGAAEKHILGVRQKRKGPEREPEKWHGD